MTGKTPIQESIKISFKPFLAIALILTGLVVVGSLANDFRMKSRFNSLIDHSQVIYNHHSENIQNILKKGEDLSKIRDVLETINSPEKGTYHIDLVRNINGSWVVYDYQVSGLDKTTLNQQDTSLINDYLKLEESKKFGFQKHLKSFYENFYKPYPYHNKDFFISVIPINQDGETIGYFVVATSKVQNN